MAALVRRHDPDRFLTALFAPADKREALLTLYAFNHELARAREAVSQPMLALMRLQWWREVIEGAHRGHEVATPLAALLDAGALDRGELLGLIEAREIEVEPFIATLGEWLGYLLGSAGGLAVAAGRLLGAPEPEALRRLGAAYGAAGVLRSVPALARQGRCLLPADVLARHGESPESVVAAPWGAQVMGAVGELAAEGRGLLAGARLPRVGRAAALPAVLARRDLARGVGFGGARGLGDRVAVVWVGAVGRL